MKQILLTISLIFATGFLFGQKQVENIKVSSSKVVFLGKTKPLKDLIAKEATSPEKKDKFRKDKKVPDNFKNRGTKHAVIKPELEHLGVDKVWQSEHSKSRSISDPIINIDGLASGGSPHDPTLSVGIDYVLQAVNVTRVGVWDKEGNPITQFNMNTLWQEIGASSEGDPIILFDQEASRWVLTEFTGPANLLIAISETSDPLGSYFAYTFSTPTFPDYPKYGIWPNHLVVTSNENGAGTLTQYFIERDSLLIGADARMQQVEIPGTSGSEQGFIVSTPIDWEGQTRPEDNRPIVVKLNDSSWGEVDNDAIEMFRFDINYDDESATTAESLLINTAPYDGFPCAALGPGFACIPQPNGLGLDGLPEVIMHAPQYRNFGSHEAIVLSFVTDVTDGEDHAGVRWIELRKSGTEDWSLYQEGSYAPDEVNRYMSNIAIDRKGNIGLAYNVSSEDVFAGIRYTGRFASDPLGLMTVPEVSVIEGTSTLNTGGRFADYSHIAVDPVDESTFWFTSEYATNGTSRTRLVSFELAQDTFDLAMTSIINPNSSFDLTATESVEVEVFNAGLNTADTYVISLSLDGTEIESITISDPLESGQSRTHIFAGTIDMSQIGDYNLSATVNFEEDLNPINDTATKIVTQRTTFDASLAIQGASAACSSANLINITIGNQGGVILTDATIDFFLNGMLVDTEEWTGNLAFGESESFDFLLSGIPDGQNEYEIILSHGGGEDLLPDDNTVSYSINNVGTEGLVTLQILTDDFAGESSWELFEEGGTEPIASGGGYTEDFTLFSEEICLDPAQCYTLVFSDAYGDGICCAYGEGNYGIFNADGVPIFTSTGEFGSSETTNFCTSDVECAIVAEVEVQDVGADGTLGSIMVFPSGGVAPFSYSLDGGQTSQESNLFDNLEADVYLISITSADGLCTEIIEVTVDMISSTADDLANEVIIKSIPNPNEGFFDLTIENYQSNEVFLHFNIHDANGRLVQSRRMANYSGIYKTKVSLLDYPSGNYFIRFIDHDLNQLIKVVKL